MGREDASGGGAKSRLPTKEDLKQIVLAFERAGVRYVLVGGVAVNLHGRVRATHDIDFLVDPSPENVKKIKEALLVLPDGAVRELGVKDLAKYTVVRVADEVVVDLIGKIGDVSIDNAGVEIVDIEGVQVKVADIETLIRTKQGLRSKDREDLLFLIIKAEQAKRGIKK